MDFNFNVKKHYQVRENTGGSKKKVKRTHSPESDDEKATYKKLKLHDCLENISPAENSLLPAESRNSPETFEKKSDGPEESLPKSKKKQERKGILGSTGHTTGLLDLQQILQRNYKMLKEKMDPTGLADKFHEMEILDSKAIKNIQRGSCRRIKNDILIKELCKVKQNNKKDVGYEIFVSFLKETGQGKVVSELVKESTSQQDALGIRPNEQEDLLSFVKEKEGSLLEEVEPRIFIDEIVADGSISVEEHEGIITKSKRRQRMHLLLEKINLSEKSVAMRIVKRMADAYPDLYTMFKSQRKGNNTRPQEEEIRQKDRVSVGSPIQMKFHITAGNTMAVQDTNEHDDLMSRMKEKRRDIERQIVDNCNGDPNQLDPLVEYCRTKFEKASLSCVKIYLKALSTKSLGKLVAYSRSSAAKKLILSLIDEETKQQLLDMNAKIVLEITNGGEGSVATKTYEKDCICNLDKESVARNRSALIEGIRSSISIIKRFVQSRLIDDKTEASLNKTYAISNQNERNVKLLQFLLCRDFPDVFFCILEEEIIKQGGADIIRVMKKDQLIENEKGKPDKLTNADIQNSKDLLQEELEVQWFIPRLEKRTDKITKTLLVKMRASECRDERIGPFLDYLLKEKDLAWFFEEIKTRNVHLFNTLLRRKVSNNTSCFERVDFKRLEAAMQFYYDDIIDEVDPLVLRKWLGADARQEMEISKLNNVPKRSKRATRFCLSLLGVSRTTLFAVLNAMTACGYKEIVEDVIRLAREGPLNDRYKCPKINNLEKCDETCVYMATFSLDETVTGATKPQQSTFSDARRDKAVCEDSISSRFQLSSLPLGSASTIYFGLTRYKDDIDTADGSGRSEMTRACTGTSKMTRACTGTSKMTRACTGTSKMTRACTESHSKLESFGISKQHDCPAHASADETKDGKGKQNIFQKFFSFFK